MFKGFSEKLKNKLEEYNQTSESFIFCVCDLEYSSDRLEGEHKFSIYSKELQQKLGKMIVASGGKISNPNAIRFSKCPSALKKKGAEKYTTWIKIRKKYLVELNETNNTKTVEFPDVNYNDNYIKRHYHKEVDFEILDAYALNRALGGPGLKHCPFESVLEVDREETKKAKDKNWSFFKTSGDALKEINQTLSENNIDIETSEIDWMYILPNWCSCEVKEFGNQENNDLYRLHINSCLWRDENEIIAFKNKMIEAIKQGRERFDNYKKEIIKEIIEKAKKQNISEKELNDNRPNWKDNLLYFKTKKAVINYQTSMLEKDIEKLVEVKNKPEKEKKEAEAKAKEEIRKEEERLKKEQEQETKKQAKQQELSQKRNQVLSEITQVLHQEPPLTNNELSPSYQNWAEQLNQLTDLAKMSNLKDRILADIQARRQDKISAQEVKENLNKAKTGTKAEQQQAWKDLENQETQKGYQDNQDQINNLKKEQATEDPHTYSQEAHHRIEDKLKENGLKIADLSSENQSALQKLKEGQITDPQQLVETENNLKQNIYQVETTKKITDFTSRVNQVLQSKSKSQINALKKELLAFLSSSNIYYATKKKEVEQLLERLENYNENSNEQNKQDNKMAMSTKIVIGVVIPLVIVGLGIIIVKKGKRKKIN